MIRWISWNPRENVQIFLIDTMSSKVETLTT